MSNIVKQHEPRLPAMQMDEQELMLEHTEKA